MWLWFYSWLFLTLNLTSLELYRLDHYREAVGSIPATSKL